MAKDYEFGMVGLGVMGRNLVLNMADHGFSVAGYDRDLNQVTALRQESKGKKTYGAENIKDFIEALRTPRTIILLVPAGHPVDAVIADLLPYLQKEDLIVDAGNSYFKDTRVRAQALLEKGIHFFGMGISGGEEGARHGPSLMPGGSKEVYERIRPMLEAVAAKVGNDPCVAYLGPRATGHFVKMVHNGIEYGIMQLISETYDFMKRGLGMNDEELHETYVQWNKGDLNGYLMEITGNIFGKMDEQTGKRLIDEILDVAKQKGTGMWTSQSAMELQVPIPVIDIAVGVRNLSMLEKQREQASKLLKRPLKPLSGDRKSLIEQLRQALYAATIVTYAQGFAVLAAAAERYQYELNLETVARIWRGGCIIRASLLEVIREAFLKDPKLSNLLLDPELARRFITNEEMLRRTVCSGVDIGIPIPGLMSALGYVEGFRSAWLPANLIQAQRDYFGAHAYERIDEKGAFHTTWETG